jgi:hypothetical protein
MKTLKFLALLCILLGFAVNTAQSQAVVMTEDQNDGRIPTYWNYYDGVWHKHISTDWHVVITPSGNINGIFTFKLDLEDPLVPENGVNKISIPWGMKDDEGNMHLTTGEAVITADGTMKLVAHFKPEKE